MLQDLIVSRVRVKLLELFFGNPGQMYHVRDMVRRTDEEINAVRRELAHLEKIGLLVKEARGNRLLYIPKKDYHLYNELLRLVAKTGGVGGEIIKNRGKLGKLRFVMFSGGFVSGSLPKADEVEILVVGQIVMPELMVFLKSEETRRGREINFTPMTEEEFVYRKQHNDPFILKILTAPKVVIIGEEEELLA